MTSATKALRVDPSSKAEEDTAAIGLNCRENDKSQASLDRTDFSKERSGKM